MTQPAPVGPGAAGDAAPRLTINRLRLRAAGLDEEAARRLATLVGEGLGPALRLPPDRTAIDTLKVKVASPVGEGPERLSKRIVDAIGRALAEEGAR
jgi:hypothetical protein